MSDEGARQLVERLFTALDEGDVDAVAGIFDDDVRFTTGGVSPIAGMASGKAEVFDKMQKIAKLTEGTARLELVACHAAGPELALVHARRHASAWGDEVEADVAMVVRAEGGKIVEVADVMDNRLAEFWTRAAAAS